MIVAFVFSGETNSASRGLHRQFSLAMRYGVDLRPTSWEMEEKANKNIQSSNQVKEKKIEGKEAAGSMTGPPEYGSSCSGTITNAYLCERSSFILYWMPFT